jgi:hypothetical protein
MDWFKGVDWLIVLYVLAMLACGVVIVVAGT